MNMDKIKRFAEKAQAGAAQVAAAAGAAAQQGLHHARAAAQEAGKAASQASEAAMTHAKKALDARASMQWVGSIVTIAGKTLIVDELLAEGGFAAVYLATTVNPATNERTGEKFVLKKMYAQGAEVVEQLTKEVKLMSQLSAGPNIVKVFGSDERPIGHGDSRGVDILVLMEYCSGGHLLSRIQKLHTDGKTLPYAKVLQVFLDIVRPVAYMHSQKPPIAHRDLKFENVLIAQDGSLRLADFGSASTHSGVIADKADRAEQEDAITRFTTPHFRSPEMVDLYSGLPLDERSDIWALGCMMYGLAYLIHPFQETGTLAILSCKYRIPASPAYPPPVSTVIRACLQFNPADRPTAIQLGQYVAACQKAPETGPWPDVSLSGGGTCPTTALPPLPRNPETGQAATYHAFEHKAAPSSATSAGGDGSVGHNSNVGAGLKKAAVYQRPPTAAEIAANIAASAAAASSSSSSSAAAALAARKAKRGMAAAPAPGALGAPSASAAAASGAGGEVDMLGLGATATASGSSQSQSRRLSGDNTGLGLGSAAPSAAVAPSAGPRRASNASQTSPPARDTTATGNAAATATSGGDWGDNFDAFGGGFTAPAPAAATSPTRTSGTYGGGSGDSPTRLQQNPVAASTAWSGDFDAFGDSAAATAAPAVSGPASAHAADPDADAFGLLGLGGDAPAPATAAAAPSHGFVSTSGARPVSSGGSGLDDLFSASAQPAANNNGSFGGASNAAPRPAMMPAAMNAFDMLMPTVAQPRAPLPGGMGMGYPAGPGGGGGAGSRPASTGYPQPQPQQQQGGMRDPFGDLMR